MSIKSISVFQDTVQRSEAGIVSSQEKKATSAIFLPEASFPALDGGVDRLYTKIFSFLVGLSPSLTDTGIILIPLSSTTKMA